ncbi:DnaD domain protein [Lactobacillus sp. YT155]|uniref:DnaD domain protein n=1 Tax=Lactobacillus sp. YT155 TaxID=3060955 RepID=UPI00265F4234|nr:DnaD domain protein [Lactobacillus sp. YT155]MDO1605611.1 DnaD domain protein [Lactobacillus sp. YT155]
MGDASINPLAGFWILKNFQLSDVQTKELIDLYQPIVGPVGIGLYLLLNNEAEQQQLISERQNHAHLLGLLDCDAPNFYSARIKLEALGLIKTYQKEDQLGQYFIYELLSSISAVDFFNDSLLSVLLLEKIGQSDFKKLSEKYENQSNVLQNSEDITKTFLEVFEVGKNELLETPEVIKEAQAKMTVPKKNKPQIKNVENVFDWTFLAQLVTQYGITQQEIEKKEDQLYELQVFYGLDELELSMLIAKAVNTIDNTIDVKKVARAAQQKYENSTNITQRAVVNTNAGQSDNPIINKANELIPSEFLAYKKRQSNGFVGSSETRVLRNLQNRHILPNSVINILIDYVLQNSPTLAQGLVETVANDWSQNKVATPEDALKRINDFNSGRSNNRKNNGNKRVEQGTDWSKVNQENEVNDDDSIALIEEANERLRKLHEANQTGDNS